MSEPNSSIDRGARCIVVGTDRGLSGLTATVMAHLQANESVETALMDVPLKASKELSEIPFVLPPAPPYENLTHRPQRKGRAGKLRRW